MNSFNINNICFMVLIIIIIVILITNCSDFFKNEKYTPILKRPLPLTKSQNTCPYPYTNNKLDNICNSNVYTYQYANRKLLSSDQYLEMVKKLLKSLSSHKIDVTNIPNNILIQKDYNNDINPLTKFLNEKINFEIKNNNYLQQNGSWKYEYFYVSSPTIYYYEVNNNNKLFKDLPSVFHLFKIIYVLSNPLRSSYTSCFAFITLINNNLELQYTSLVNDIDSKSNNIDNLDVISKEALKFSFIDTIANNNFNKFGYSNEKSGTNYTEYNNNLESINVKPDIPNEFKKNNFHFKHLPPLFGNGNVPYN